MAIHYQCSLHRLRCQCGQLFYLNCGDTEAYPPKTITKTSATCPACGHVAWLSRQYAAIASADHNDAVRKPVDQKPPKKGPTYNTHKNELLFDDLPVLEETIDIYRHDRREFQFHLYTLSQAVRKAVRSWNKHWNRSVMPKEFNELVRILREIGQVDDGLRH
jgi:hypothetical protein